MEDPDCDTVNECIDGKDNESDGLTDLFPGKEDPDCKNGGRKEGTPDQIYTYKPNSCYNTGEQIFASESTNNQPPCGQRTDESSCISWSYIDSFSNSIWKCAWVSDPGNPTKPTSTKTVAIWKREMLSYIDRLKESIPGGDPIIVMTEFQSLKLDENNENGMAPYNTAIKEIALPQNDKVFSVSTDGAQRACTSYSPSGECYVDWYHWSYNGLKAVTDKLIAQTLGAIGSKNNLVFVFTGESNAAGLGDNSVARQDEIDTTSSVKILTYQNNSYRFEDLKIGINNQELHPNYNSVKNELLLRHGFELELSNQVESGKLSGTNPVYLLKTAVTGAHVVNEWNKDSFWWGNHLKMIDAAKSKVPKDAQWVVWLSLGINDAILNNK